MKWRTAIVLAAAVLIPTIMIPAKVATGVGDTASEREIVEAYVRNNFVWFKGKHPLLQVLRKRFVFVDLRSTARYTLKENDEFKAKFRDGSSVRFRFIGNINCPSGLCFEWVVGSETPATRVIPKPPLPRRAELHPQGDHPGKERGDHYVHTASYNPPTAAPYDPYNPDNWSGPAPGFDSTTTVRTTVRSSSGGRR